MQLTRSYLPTSRGIAQRPTEIVIDPNQLEAVKNKEISWQDRLNQHGQAWDKLALAATTLGETAAHPFGSKAPTGTEEASPPPFELGPEVEAGSTEEKVVNNYLTWLKEANVPIGPTEWHQLITSVSLVDFRSNSKAKEIGDQYGITPLALIDGSGQLQLDHKFGDLSETQQRYVLSHELAHQLDAFLADSQPEKYDRLSKLLQQVKNNAEISHYVDGLARSFDNGETDNKIWQESMAEVIGQYIAGGQTFAGMIKAKLGQFPEGTAVNSQVFEDLQRCAEDIESWDDYLQFADDERYRDDFFDVHQQLRVHHDMFSVLSEIFQDSNVFNELSAFQPHPEEVWDGEDILPFIYPGTYSEELVSVYEDDPPSAEPKTFKSSKLHFWEVFNFFNLFG